MATRIVEGKKPYTGGKAIEVTDDKVINLRLRDENNLIIYDEGDDEIYVDLQLPDGVRPLDVFPVGVTTGRVLVADDWDLTGTIICAKTTSGDNIKLLYGDDGTLWIDNGTGTFKQIYFRADVDLITQRLQAQIDLLYALGKFLSLWDCASGEPMSFPLNIPYNYNTGDWYMIGNVSSDTPAVNYRPAGSEWIEDEPSTKEQETEVVEIGDVYIYDGTIWLLQHNELPVGSGNVIGPDHATDGDITLFDGATGKIIKDSGKSLNDYQEKLTAGSGISIDQNNEISNSAQFNPGGTATTGYVVTKTELGYEWAAPSGGSEIEYVTQAQYEALLPGAESDGKNYVIFVPTAVTGVEISEDSISLPNIGDSYQLSATVYPTDAYNKSVTWESNNTSIATVDQTGLVTCVTPGIATITVTTVDGGFTSSCIVDDDSGGFVPGPNTIAYFPLSTDELDYSGNSYSIGYNGTQDTVGYKYDYSGTVAPITHSNINFFSIWYKAEESDFLDFDAVIGNYGRFGDIQYNLCRQSGQTYQNKIAMWNSSGWSSSGLEMTGGLTKGSWHHYAWGYDGTNIIIAKDGVVSTFNVGPGYSYNNNFFAYKSSNYLGASNKWIILSDIILEDTCWSNNDIVNYYNSTKGVHHDTTIQNIGMDLYNENRINIGVTQNVQFWEAPYNPTDTSVTITSSDSNIVSVGTITYAQNPSDWDSGSVAITGVSAGTATITITANDTGVSASYTYACSATPVTPAFTPGNNTIAYFPLTTDILDASGNNISFIGSVSDADKQGIGYRQRWSGRYKVINQSRTDIRFFSAWYKTGERTNDLFGRGNIQFGNYGLLGDIQYNIVRQSNDAYVNKIAMWDNSGWTGEHSSNGMTYGEWHHYAWGYDGTNLIIAKDGVVSTLSSSSGYNFGNYFYGISFDYRLGGQPYPLFGITLSDVIIEDTCWSQQDIEDYYNATKDSYPTTSV